MSVAKHNRRCGMVWYGKRERERDPFNCPLSRTTRVSWYQKGKPIWILLKQETVSGSGISWAVCKSAPRSRQITMPAPHHSVFLQAGCPSCRPTNSVKALKAWYCMVNVDSYSAIITIVYNALVDPRTKMLMKYVFVRKIEKVVCGSQELQKTELEDYSSALWCRPNIDMVWSHIARRQWFARSAWS